MSEREVPPLDRIDRSELAAKLEEAKRHVTDAEANMEKLIRELRVTARAEKTTISLALESAFTTLRSARLNLEALEVLLRE